MKNLIRVLAIAAVVGGSLMAPSKAGAQITVGIGAPGYGACGASCGLLGVNGPIPAGASVAVVPPVQVLDLKTMSAVMDEDWPYAPFGANGVTLVRPRVRAQLSNIPVF